MPLISRTWRLPAIMLAVCLVALAVLSGPLFPFAPLPSDIADVVAKVPDVDLYLSRREAQHAEIKPGQAKTILWNDPAARSKTPLALVYIHGFSASRKDVAPVVETLAGTLGANAFLTRLAAHGRTTPAEFAAVSAQDWLDDAREALARTKNRRSRDPDRNLDRRTAGNNGGARGQLTRYRGPGAAVAEFRAPGLAGEIHLRTAWPCARTPHHRQGTLLPAR